MFRVISEWDIGYEHCVFTTGKVAMDHLGKNVHIREILNESGDAYLTLDDLFDEGLLAIERLNVIG